MSGSSRWIAGVPNALSIGRLLAAVAFPFASAPWRLPIAVCAGLSDGLDGFIARRFDAKSTSGALIDAIADKAFVISVLATLASLGEVRWWQIALVLARDGVVGFTAAYAAATMDWRRFKQMRPRPSGKLVTLFVFIWFGALLAPASWSWVRGMAPSMFTLTAAASVVAGIDYLVCFVRALAARGPDALHEAGSD